MELLLMVCGARNTSHIKGSPAIDNIFPRAHKTKKNLWATWRKNNNPEHIFVHTESETPGKGWVGVSKFIFNAQSTTLDLSGWKVDGRGWDGKVGGGGG